MRVIVLALALVSSAAVAQPTTDKPPETSPTGTTNVATIKVTTKKFASLTAGKKMTAAGLKKAFPKAKFKFMKSKDDPYWKIDGANDLKVRANTEEIVVLGGPVEVHGVMIGDDGKELSGGNFTGAYCIVESEGHVSCSKDALRFVLSPCSAKEDGGSVPLGALAGCKVLEIRFIAYAPRE